MRSIRPLKLAAAALAAAAIAPAVAAAAPAVNGVFDLPGRPQRLALGPDGNVWITLDSGGDVARVSPDGSVERFDSPAISNPIGITAGPDGQMWVTQSGGVAHFSPADPTAARAVPIAALASAQTIVTGPDGNLWTGSNDQAIRIGTDERARAFRVTGLVGARGIVAGGDGKLYIADFNGGQIVGITTDGAATPYPTGGGPQQVAAGPAGQIAYTNQGNVPHQLGFFTPPAVSVTRIDVPNTDPFGIVYAVDEAYWTANFASDTLTRMTPAGAITTLGGFARASGPRYLTTGRDGTLWVGLETTSQVARVTGVTAPPRDDGRGGGGGGGGTADTTKPVLTKVRAPVQLRVGKRGTLRLTSSEAATVTVRFERKLAGRRKAGKCVKPRRAPHGRRCVRFVAAGSQRFGAQEGANRLSIGGKIGKRVLPAGAYRVTITAKDAAGNVSKPARKALSVVVPRRR